ncbi:MAG: Uma2 family endonuclease [Lamprocystis purpurea]|uniref:Uma2 family endonuclease n=1 Tax=Lamprocystis purpurea TaxID=61598 RepID=UPI0003641638|nr:Uma2 family endonuclease [Lamprocystis purpurea]MBV5272510.1 Uma2 family endonuclease [Lamprocystis purpurea]
MRLNRPTPSTASASSSSSLALDLGAKLSNYARAGIHRYWVVDLRHRILHDHRDPDRFGRRYRQVHSLTTGEVVFELGDARIGVPVAAILPD